MWNIPNSTNSQYITLQAGSMAGEQKKSRCGWGTVDQRRVEAHWNSKGGGRKSPPSCRTPDFILQVMGNHWRKVFNGGVTLYVLVRSHWLLYRE